MSRLERRIEALEQSADVASDEPRLIVITSPECIGGITVATVAGTTLTRNEGETAADFEARVIDAARTARTVAIGYQDVASTDTQPTTRHNSSG